MNQNSSNNSSSRRLSSNDTDLSGISIPTALMAVTDTGSVFTSSTDSSSDYNSGDGGDQLGLVYDDWSLLAMIDSNGVLEGNIAENWDAPLWPDPNKGTMAFSSAEGSHLTYKYNLSGDEFNGVDSVNYDFIGAAGNTLKISDSWNWKSYRNASKTSITYQEGAGTKADKTDDLKLTVTAADKGSTKNDVFSGTSTVTASYSDGRGYKFSFKGGATFFAGETSTSTTTVSNLSYSDADGNKFKFSGTFDQDGTIQLKSASLTLDGETIKFGKQPITTDSGFDAFSLLPFTNNSEPSFNEGDFNGSDVDGMGHVADFVVLLGNWVDFNSSLG